MTAVAQTRSAKWCVNQSWDHSARIGTRITVLLGRRHIERRIPPSPSHRCTSNLFSTICATASMDRSSQPVAAASHGCGSGAASDREPPGACSSSTVSRKSGSPLDLWVNARACERPLRLAGRRPCRRWLPASGAEARVKRREFLQTSGSTPGRNPAARRLTRGARLRYDGFSVATTPSTSCAASAAGSTGRISRLAAESGCPAAGSSPTTRPERRKSRALEKAATSGR
jgi:hypothetical protein